VSLTEGGRRQRKTPNLVGNERFQAWWPLKCYKFGGQWNVPSLVAFRRKRKNIFVWGSMEKHPCLVAYEKNKKIIFISFHFSPQKILLEPYSPLTLRLWFTMVLNHYFVSFLLSL
jgi:hypothetical protein